MHQGIFKIVTLILLVGMSACAPAIPAATFTPTISPTPSNTPTPTATATPIPSPTLPPLPDAYLADLQGQEYEIVNNQVLVAGQVWFEINSASEWEMRDGYYHHLLHQAGLTPENSWPNFYVNQDDNVSWDRHVNVVFPEPDRDIYKEIEIEGEKFNARCWRAVFYDRNDAHIIHQVLFVRGLKDSNGNWMTAGPGMQASAVNEKYRPKSNTEVYELSFTYYYPHPELRPEYKYRPGWFGKAIWLQSPSYELLKQMYDGVAQEWPDDIFLDVNYISEPFMFTPVR